MQLTLPQFLLALTANFTQGLSAEAGIVTLESGDTFDVKANAKQLQTLLMSASLDLKDAHEEIVNLISAYPSTKQYFQETRQQLVEYRQGLEALDLSGTAAPAATSTTDMMVSLDGGSTYRAAPNGVRIIYDKVDVPGENEPGQLHLNATSEGLITDVWVSREEHLDHNIGTKNESLDTIVGDLVEENL